MDGRGPEIPATRTLAAPCLAGSRRQARVPLSRGVRLLRDPFEAESQRRRSTELPTGASPASERSFPLKPAGDARVMP